MTDFYPIWILPFSGYAMMINLFLGGGGQLLEYFQRLQCIIKCFRMIFIQYLNKYAMKSF